jgi:hypothetical protein
MISAFVILFGFALVLSAAEKDSALAARTRKKLGEKVSVEFQDEHLSECLKEISRQLEDAGIGSISFSYDTGVSQNQRVSYSGKGQTVAEALDGLLKKNSLGYVVISKEKDRYDGWIKIKQGSERGYAAGEEPKEKTRAKEVTKAPPPPSTKPAGTDQERAEKAAMTKLEFARSLLKDGKTDRARQRFEEIVQQHPETKAAEEAKKELAKLGK